VLPGVSVLGLYLLCALMRTGAADWERSPVESLQRPPGRIPHGTRGAHRKPPLQRAGRSVATELDAETIRMHRRRRGHEYRIETELCKAYSAGLATALVVLRLERRESEVREVRVTTAFKQTAVVDRAPLSLTPAPHCITEGEGAFVARGRAVLQSQEERRV